jgi:hypothetical protein
MLTCRLLSVRAGAIAIYDLALALLAALAVLTKQSTGLFFSAGMIVSLAIEDFRNQPPTIAIARLTRFALLVGISVIAVVWLLRGLVSPSDMVYQVFVIGSLPKGGVPTLMRNLLYQARDAAGSVVLAAIFLMFLAGVLRFGSLDAFLGRLSARAKVMTTSIAFLCVLVLVHMPLPLVPAQSVGT